MRRIITVAAAAIIICATHVAAQENRMQPDFTFRRVTVPGVSASNRITVQIDPDAPSAIRAPDPEDDLDPPANDDATESTIASALAEATSSIPAPSAYDWFWAAVSPAMADSGPGRLEPAVEEISNAPDGSQVPTPRMQMMQDIARAHGTDILRATVGTKVSPALVLAIISVESAGRIDAVSSAGAAGLMQLMPATAERFGVTDRLVAEQSIMGGVAYLDFLMGEFKSDPILVIAGYNSGEGSIRDNSGVPPYAETRAYVPKVLAAWTVARGLCQTPPDLISDGCVFAVNNL
ncbi:MAG: lytic transglycosylase domain-containing protein [Rhodobacterales bacterium]|nr:lytic transglycosylase domain-containing protein [Rhodobacterales bacterium]